MNATAKKLFSDDEPQELHHYYRHDERTYKETFQADEAVLKARGYASDFCGAWVAIWAHIKRDYGVALEEESARMNARKGKEGETCEQILEKARSVAMAVIGAAVRDKSKSRIRRFQAGAAYLEATRRGEDYDSKEKSEEEAERIRANLARNWRSIYPYLYMVQRVTHLPFVEREARDFNRNKRAAEAAWYTDRITDLLSSVITTKNTMRGPRAERFNRAVAHVLDRFRRECAHECLSPKTCRQPHIFAPHWQAGVVDESDGDARPNAEPKPRKKVIDFGKAKAKILAGIEIASARFEAARLTPAEAEELVTMLAPMVEMAMHARKSADGCVEPYADLTTETEFEGQAPDAEFVPRTQNEDCNFAEEKRKNAESLAEINLRKDAPSPAPPEATLDDFLSVFFPNQYEDINLRAFAPSGAPDEPRFEAKTWRTCREALACDQSLLDGLHEANRTRGLYFVVNAGGNKAKEITRVNAFFAEADESSLTDQHAKFDAAPLSPTLRNETLKSVHGFYPAALGVRLEDFDEIQRRLIAYFKSDAKIKDRSRVMRLLGFNHVAFNGGLLSSKPVTIAAFDPARRFTAAEMLAAFPAVPVQSSKHEYRIPMLSDLANGFEGWKRELGQRIAAHRSAQRNGKGIWDCQGVCHNGKGVTGLFYNPAQNFIWCNSETSCDLNTIAASFGMSAYLGGAA